MKVLQVTTHLNIGGIANYILTLSGSLKSKGVEVAVASSGGSLEEEFVRRGIKCERLNIRTKFEFGPKALMSAFMLSRIIRREKIDLIHAHTRVSQVAASLASKFTGVPYVTTCHGYFKMRSRSIFDTWGEAVIAISGAVAKHLKDDLGVGGERIRLIYSGVDARRFAGEYSEADKEGLKKALGLKEGPVIGSIGRLSPVKGHRYLIQAMAEILSFKKDAQCLIVGDGDQRPALVNLAKALGIGNAIHFADSDLDTAKYLSIMDIFVFPSVKEGLGIALLEAMAAGKACIASDIGGISDIVEGPSCGMLVPVGDVRAIAGSAIKLIDDGALRRSLGKNAMAVVSEKFSLDGMGDKVIQLYKASVGDLGT